MYVYACRDDAVDVVDVAMAATRLRHGHDHSPRRDNAAGATGGQPAAVATAAAPGGGGVSFAPQDQASASAVAAGLVGVAEEDGEGEEKEEEGGALLPERQEGAGHRP